MVAKSKYFPKKLNHPMPGKVWLHIDHFDKKSKNVWAVQYWRDGKLRYKVAAQVNIYRAHGWTRQLKGQPRAVIEFVKPHVFEIGPKGMEIDIIGSFTN